MLSTKSSRIFFSFRLNKIGTKTKKNKNSGAIKIGKLESELKPRKSFQLETTQGKTKKKKNSPNYKIALAC
jgi:hypothetical protein